jgi:hypothetical protein
MRRCDWFLPCITTMQVIACIVLFWFNPSVLAATVLLLAGLISATAWFAIESRIKVVARLVESPCSRQHIHSMPPTCSVALPIYENLLTRPGDAPTMLVLSDALEDEGEMALAAAYRWAALHGKWPFLRHELRLQGPVYDWDRVGRELPPSDVPVPESAQLSLDIYKAIKQLPHREYGDVNRAFVLLARVLFPLPSVEIRNGEQSEGTAGDLPFISEANP